jgi:hypothetical protein
VLLWYDREKHRSEVLLGTDAGNTYVAVDGTFVTRRKYERGRRLKSHKQIVIGAVEVHHNGGLTGRARLEVIPNVKRDSIEPFIRRHVAQGAFIYTDSHASYKWLREGGWPLHGTVNHKKGQWVNHTTSATTNAIEGVWMLVKTLFRY